MTTNLTKEPDVVFKTSDNRTIAVEVETGIKKPTEERILKKVSVLQKYDEWFFVVTNFESQGLYEKYREVLTRIKLAEKIDSYFQAPDNPESKTESETSPD
ncbi:MAG: hypothetical protein KKD39_01430 [Candidatus Altiarchaeota archaeon]|nr:hypothetical protein [Candidatus Altiarchaeota archaeon]